MSVAMANQGMLDKMDISPDTYMTLKGSIFPGAKDESIHMALAYCRAAHLDRRFFGSDQQVSMALAKRRADAASSQAVLHNSASSPRVPGCEDASGRH